MTRSPRVPPGPTSPLAEVYSDDAISPDGSRELTITDPGARSTTDGLPATVSVPSATAPLQAPAVERAVPELTGAVPEDVDAGARGADRRIRRRERRGREPLLRPPSPRTRRCPPRDRPRRRARRRCQSPAPALATTGCPPTAPVLSGVGAAPADVVTIDPQAAAGALPEDVDQPGAGRHGARLRTQRSEPERDRRGPRPASEPSPGEPAVPEVAVLPLPKRVNPARTGRTRREGSDTRAAAVPAGGADVRRGSPPRPVAEAEAPEMVVGPAPEHVDVTRLVGDRLRGARHVGRLRQRERIREAVIRKRAHPALIEVDVARDPGHRPGVAELPDLPAGPAPVVLRNRRLADEPVRDPERIQRERRRVDVPAPPRRRAVDRRQRADRGADRVHHRAQVGDDDRLRLAVGGLDVDRRHRGRRG